jgi:beta-glucosidase
MQRVTLSPGESKTIRFPLARKDLEFIGQGSKRIAEPGMFDIWVGQSSSGGLHTQIELYAAALPQN